MKLLSITLPDEIIKRLEDLASNRNVSINELMNEFLIRTLLEEEAKQQSFLSSELLESRKRGLKLLKELDVLNLEKPSTRHL